MRFRKFHFKFKNRLLVLGSGLIFLILNSLSAQDGVQKISMPITVSVFSESVSLPNLRGFFKNPNWGVRIGTEFYYRQNDKRQLLQTLNLGYYRHNGFQQGVFVSTELGYRKSIGRFFADATIGAGYLHLVSDLKRYRPADDSFLGASQRLHKIMPTLGLGLGYRFRDLTIFSRYELFGEMPFNYGGAPVLPHKTIHFGTRFQPFK